MPRYHFHVYDGVAHLDDEGQHFETREDARFEAIRSAGEIIKDQSRRCSIGGDWRMEVTDDRGSVLIRLDFRVLEAPASARRCGTDEPS